MKQEYLRNLLLKPPPAFLTEISFFSFPNEQNPADLFAELVISKWPLKYLVARVNLLPRAAALTNHADYAAE